MAYPFNNSDRYPNGYLPKIQYWAEVMAEAAHSGDFEMVQHAKGKIEYFFVKEHVNRLPIEQQK